MQGGPPLLLVITKNTIPDSLAASYLQIGRCDRVASPVWVGEGIEEGVQGAFHQLYKGLLDRILPTAAQDAVL